MEATATIEFGEKREDGIDHEAYRALRDTLSKEHTLSFHTGGLADIVLPEQLTPESVILDAKRLQLRGESGHNVFSCDLALPQQDGEITSVPCLVKKHDKPRKGETEFRNTQRVKEKGIRTIEPIAFVGDQERSFVFLAFDPTLRSADTIQWDSLTGQTRQHEITGFLGKTAGALAQLHARGIFHHDTYLRNVSYQKDDSVFFFDWEKAHIYNQSKAFEDTTEFVPKAGKDLGRLFESCCREELLQTQEVRSSVLHQFDDLVLSPYQKALFEENQKIAVEGSLKEFADKTFTIPPHRPSQN